MILEDSKSSHPHKLLLRFTDKTDLRMNEKSVLLTL